MNTSNYLNSCGILRAFTTKVNNNQNFNNATNFNLFHIILHKIHVVMTLLKCLKICCALFIRKTSKVIISIK